MDSFKKLGVPVLFVFLSAFFIKVLKVYFVSSVTNTVIRLLFVMTLFFFGFLLNNNRKRKSKSVLKKVISILFFILLYLIQYGYINSAICYNMFETFGIHEYFIHMLYILCGYIFAD